MWGNETTKCRIYIILSNLANVTQLSRRQLKEVKRISKVKISKKGVLGRKSSSVKTPGSE